MNLGVHKAGDAAADAAVDKRGAAEPLGHDRRGGQADLEAGKKDSYKVKYDALKEDFEKFKNEQTQKENHEAKESAYRGILKAAGISEKRIDAILKVSDIDSLEIEDGKIKDAEKLTENAKKEWADFVVVETTNGVKTPNPPANNPIPAEPKNLADALRVKYEKG